MLFSVKSQLSGAHTLRDIIDITRWRFYAGMAMGGVRHVSDIRADDMDKAGATVIGLQMGSNKGASQAGMNIGGVR